MFNTNIIAYIIQDISYYSSIKYGFWNKSSYNTHKFYIYYYCKKCEKLGQI